MEDEEDDEEEEHATERRSFASVSTGSACGERSWSSLVVSIWLFPTSGVYRGGP